MESLHGGGENCGGQEGSLETIFQTPPPPLCPVSTCACTPPPSHTAGVDIIVTTLPGWGWGGGVEPGGSDDGMTITICSFSSSDSSSSGSADTDDSELQAIWQNVSRNNCTLWTVFIRHR